MTDTKDLEILHKTLKDLLGFIEKNDVADDDHYDKERSPEFTNVINKAQEVLNGHQHTEETTLAEEGYICNNCGAFANSPEKIRHHDTCQVGESKKWEKIYAEAEKIEETWWKSYNPGQEKDSGK